MAHVLNAPQKPRTLRAALHFYLRQIFWIVIVLIALSACFYFLFAWKIVRENRQIYLVNDFYGGLYEEQEAVSLYFMKKEEDLYPPLEEEAGRLLSSLDTLCTLSVTSTVRRDLQDLTGLLENYRDQLQLLQQALDGGGISEANAAYVKMQSIYGMMNNSFHYIYSQILSSSEDASSAARRSLLLYTALMLLTFTLLVRFILLQIQQMEDQIVRPIQQLAEDVQHIDLHHLDHPHDLSGTAGVSLEIVSLIQVYNAMLEKISRQLQEEQEYTSTRLRLQEQELLNLQISNELKKSQFRNLQMQINPHFLFNTLTMISHSAYLADDMHTVTLLNTTSDLLRYILDFTDKAVPLEKEIEILGSYVYLQEQRFGDRIRFIFDLDESFHQVLLPNMILQPLLENSIVHGIGMRTQGGVITIRTAYDQEHGRGCIQIADNGEGMDEKTAAAVRARLASPEAEPAKIGLSNVAFRLNLFFNGSADLTFTTAPGEGTTFEIRIPCARSGNYSERPPSAESSSVIFSKSEKGTPVCIEF